MKLKQVFYTLLEINDVCFKYYIGLYIFLAFLEIWKENLVFRYLHFPLRWFLIFVCLSGLIKFISSKMKIDRIGRGKDVSDSSRKFFQFSFLYRKIKKYLPKISWANNLILSISFFAYAVVFLLTKFKEIKFLNEHLFLKLPLTKWLLSKGDGWATWLLFVVILTCLLSGLLALLVKRKRVKGKTKNSEDDLGERGINTKTLIAVGVAGLLGAFLIFFQNKALGWFAFFFAVLGDLLIVSFSLIILKKDVERQISKNL